LRALGAEEVENLIADAVQSLALVASTSESHFRGVGEASARAWCRSVLLNHVSNELRARKARQSVHPADLRATWTASDDRRLETIGTAGERPLDAQELANAFRVLRAVRAHVFSGHRRRDAETTMRAIWCYLAYMSGAPLEEQVRALRVDEGLASDAPNECAADSRRWRNRVYKLRERGRRALHGLWGTADAKI
jgi:hypothetical protein